MIRTKEAKGPKLAALNYMHETETGDTIRVSPCRCMKAYRGGQR